ncbi:MAG: hypothetical protein J0H74_14370 [Chitinophagaceae bacterium]|nr:hypothetical protein [Chitinophagaceae bacterium]
MEPITTLLATAAGYILKGAAHSKTADKAKEQVLGTFWKWIRPKFVKDVQALEDKPDDPATEVRVQERLLELVKDEHFFRELQQQVELLQQAGITEKNIVRKDIMGVKKIVIGDKTYGPGAYYDRKNIVEGDIRDADEFILGDGH